MKKLPKGWVWSTVGQALENHDSARVPVKRADRARRHGHFPYYGASGVIDRIDDFTHDGAFLLVGEDGANLLSRSKPIAFVARGQFWVNNHAHVLLPHADMPLGYFEAHFNAIDLAPYVTGSAQPKLPQGAMNKIPVPLAPLPEQHRIVAEIEKHFTRLDAAVATLERVKANLARARASVLKAAVEGRLVPTEAALAAQGRAAQGHDYEPASVLLDRILAERRRRHDEAQAAATRKKKYKEPVKPDTEGLPELPEGWVWATVDALIVGGPTNGIYVPKAKYGSGTPIMRIADFNDRDSRPAPELQQVQIPAEEAVKYALKPGDLVINRVNSATHLGKCLAVEERHVPAVFESNMMRLHVAPATSLRMLQVWLRSLVGRKRLTTNAKWAVNQASINQTDVRTTPVPLPPLPEQHRIVAEVDRRLSVLDALVQTVDTNLARCARLRQSILKRAFEGKLVPQDPNDEPASALLARIQARPR